MAAATGLKNGSVASVRFGQIKKKLAATGNEGSAPAGNVNKFNDAGTNSPAKRKGSEAPKSRGRKPNKMAKVNKQSLNKQLEDDENSEYEKYFPSSYGGDGETENNSGYMEVKAEDEDDEEEAEI